MDIEHFFPFSNLNDQELINILNSDTHRYPLRIIDSLTYTITNNLQLSTHNTIDDVHEHILPEPICEYTFCDDDISLTFPPNRFNIISYNISSVPQHLDSFLDQCINPSGVSMDIVGVCETRLNDTICNMYNIDHYLSFFQSRSTQGGGIGIFLHNKFQGIKINNASLQLQHIESLFISITHPVECVIGMVYRPPNASLNDFLESMEEVLNLVSNSTVKCYIMGDFNINLLNMNNNVINYTTLFQSYNFFQTVTKPTRVTDTSATLIDHFWTNDIHNYVKSGILYMTISDHFPIYSSFSVTNVTTTDKVCITKRTYNENQINAFKEELKQYNWDSEISNVNDIDVIYGLYMNKFKVLYNNHFPIKSFLVKEKHVCKPYITPGIIRSIKHRNKLQRLYAKWPLTYGSIFRNYRNMLTKIIRTAKENYLKSELLQNSNDARKTWKTINQLLGKTNSKLPLSMHFQNDNISGNSNIAKAFNTYFSTVASRMAADIRPTNILYDTFLPEPVPFSFFLKPTTEQEIIEVIKKLKTTSPGHDEISIKVIKECAVEISAFLKFFINKCFQVGYFPKQLKIAKIIPIHKKGDKSVNTNYRPISILPAFCKVIEKIFSVRLLDYFSKFSLFTKYQYGFRPNYSTELAINELCQSIYNVLDDRKHQITVFCDLSKAFDTVSHDILLHKLDIYGIRGRANDFLKEYLRSRQQYTVYNNNISSYHNVHCGVPQGSILGPVLFLIYINDIVRVSNRIKYLLFADDTTLYIQGQNLNDIANTLNNELSKVSDWINANKLTINVSKTVYMISTSQNNNLDFRINIDNIVLNQVNDIKFLGVIIDDKLTWKQHLYYLNNKLSQITGVFYKLRYCMTNECIKLLYMSTAYPHILYCSAIWGGAYKTLLDNLFITQKKLIRIMFFVGKFEHTSPLFLNNNLLKLPDIVFLQTCLFVFKSIHVFPVNTSFEYINQSISSRRPHDLRMPLCRTVQAQRSVRVRGVRCWNSLSQELKTTISIHVFKNKIKSSLLSNNN